MPFRATPSTRSASASPDCAAATNFGPSMAGMPSFGGPPRWMANVETLEFDTSKPLKGAMSDSVA